MDWLAMDMLLVAIWSWIAGIVTGIAWLTIALLLDRAARRRRRKL